MVQAETLEEKEPEALAPAALAWFRVEGLSLGFEFRVSALFLVFRVSGLGFRVWGLGFGV